MAAKRNPAPAVIPVQTWLLWLGFDDLEATALLGGIWADKPGYHGKPEDLPLSDYSLQLAADKAGPRDKAAAIDLTMSTSAMKKYTARLDKAARARDPRLFIGGEPILREFIGTLDGVTVYCWVLVGGKALGVGADAGPDPGRDKSHLWHIHLSIIRKFVNHPELADRLLSVLSGETLAAWQARTTTSTGDDMQQSDKLVAKTSNPNRDVGDLYGDLSNHRDWEVSPVGTPGLINPPAPGSPAQLILAMARDWQAESARQRLRDEAILTAVKGLPVGDVLARVDQRAAQLVEAVGMMRSQIATELAPLLAAAIREELAGVPAEAWAAHSSTAAEAAIRRVLGGLDGMGA